MERTEDNRGEKAIRFMAHGLFLLLIDLVGMVYSTRDDCQLGNSEKKLILRAKRYGVASET